MLLDRLRAKGPLPDPRPLIAPLRGLDSAQTSLSRLPDHRLLLTIRHVPLEGVTPEMLVWWFQNIEGTITVEGHEYPRYLIWHPFDHIAYEATRLPNGRIGAGVRFRIVEAFGRDPGLRIDTRDHVDLLDESGLRLSGRFAGLEFVSLHHRFTHEGSGTQYDSTMLVGLPGRLGRLLNPLIIRRVFGERHGRAWLKHNVEEVGLFEQMLPPLFAGRGGAEPAAGEPPAAEEIV